jgi:hypothetical protein
MGFSSPISVFGLSPPFGGKWGNLPPEGCFSLEGVESPEGELPARAEGACPRKVLFLEGVINAKGPEFSCPDVFTGSVPCLG